MMEMSMIDRVVDCLLDCLIACVPGLLLACVFARLTGWPSCFNLARRCLDKASKHTDGWMAGRIDGKRTIFAITAAFFFRYPN